MEACPSSLQHGPLPSWSLTALQLPKDPLVSWFLGEDEADPGEAAGLPRMAAQVHKPDLQPEFQQPNTQDLGSNPQCWYLDKVQQTDPGVRGAEPDV